jgi:hypothetical protein
MQDAGSNLLQVFCDGFVDRDPADRHITPVVHEPREEQPGERERT